MGRQNFIFIIEHEQTWFYKPIFLINFTHQIERKSRTVGNLETRHRGKGGRGAIFISEQKN